MSIAVVQELKDGWDKWHNFSGDGVTKATRDLVLMVSIVCWMKVRSSIRVSK